MLLTGVAVSIARCGREKEINAQVMAAKEEQTRQELRMQQESEELRHTASIQCLQN